MKIEVVLSPKDLPDLARRDLSQAVCVVFDILRATSTFVTALERGAEAIVPVSEIAEAVAFRQKQPGVLLGGERDGVKISAAQSGGVDFDLGNSPREYAAATVRNKIIVSTTTNGTRALRACTGAQTLLAGSFLNLTATARFVRQARPEQVILVCAGTRENVADEDVLAAGALAEQLHPAEPPPPPSSQPLQIARRRWNQAKSDLPAAVSGAENARRLLTIPELRDDVAFCLQLDRFPLVAKMERDAIRVAPD